MVAVEAAATNRNHSHPTTAAASVTSRRRPHAPSKHDRARRGEGVAHLLHARQKGKEHLRILLGDQLRALVQPSKLVAHCECHRLRGRAAVDTLLLLPVSIHPWAHPRATRHDEWVSSEVRRCAMSRPHAWYRPIAWAAGGKLMAAQQSKHAPTSAISLPGGVCAERSPAATESKLGLNVARRWVS